ncbi:cell division protein FtsL [Pelosinus sp. sgz500959]|uniref:cell division protein FtsL n=1 Tax=Pelosinus sp. sgz500959 TaxID=3242472 RepID=UPI00366F547B
MLVNRKQQSNIYEQHEIPPVRRSLPKLDIALRAKCLATVMLLFAIAMVSTVRSEAIVRNGYDLVQMKSQVVSLQRENELLSLDIAKLKSPQRIQSIATTELGMVVPKDVYCAANIPQNAPTNTEKEKGLVSQVVNTLKSNKGL